MFVKAETVSITTHTFEFVGYTFQYTITKKNDFLTFSLRRESTPSDYSQESILIEKEMVKDGPNHLINGFAIFWRSTPNSYSPGYWEFGRHDGQVITLSPWHPHRNVRHSKHSRRETNRATLWQSESITFPGNVLNQGFLFSLEGTKRPMDNRK